jgi:hypothetical protein
LAAAAAPDTTIATHMHRVPLNLQPLLQQAENLGNDLEDACGKVKNGDILLKIHDLLEYREKVAMIIENMKNVFMSYTFFQCQVGS